MLLYPLEKLNTTLKEYLADNKNEMLAYQRLRRVRKMHCLRKLSFLSKNRNKWTNHSIQEVGRHGMNLNQDRKWKIKTGKQSNWLINVKKKTLLERKPQ